MKTLFSNKFFRIGIGLFVTAMLFLLGHHEEAGGAMVANTTLATLAKDPELDETTKNVITAVQNEIKQQVSDAQKGLLTPDKAKEQIDEIVKGLKENELKALTDTINDQGEILNQIKNNLNGGSEAGKSFKEQLREALKLNADALKDVYAKNNGVVKISITDKAAETVDTGNFGAGVIRGLRETEIDRRQMRERTIMAAITIINGGKDSDPISWLERRAKEGGAAFVAEGAAKPYLDHTWTEGKASAEFIAVATPVSRKALTVFSILENEINSLLEDELMDALEEYIIRNAGASALVNSIWSYAKAFTGASLANKVNNAQEFDVLRAAILQARKGNPSDVKHSGRLPNRIYISLDKQAEMDLIKISDGRYLLPPFMSVDGTRISGVEVIGTEFLGDDEFLVGDFTRYAFNVVSPMDIQIGYINDQFIKNELMIRAEMMGNGRVKYHDTWSFVRGTFTAAKAALETP